MKKYAIILYDGIITKPLEITKNEKGEEVFFLYSRFQLLKERKIMESWEEE